MTSGDAWCAPISDDAAAFLRQVLVEHMRTEHGWCRCGQAGCGRRWEAAVGLAVAGRLILPPPWAVQPEQGRWDTWP